MTTMKTPPPPPPSRLSSNYTTNTPTSPKTPVPKTEAPNTQLSFQTPPFLTPNSTSSAIKSASRFKFHSDTKAPNELTKLEQQSARNVTAFRTRINEIDKKIALWNSKFANEIVDRDRDMVGMLDYVCVDPLERANERFFHHLNAALGDLWGNRPEIIEEDDDDDDDDDDADEDDDDILGDVDEDNDDGHHLDQGDDGEGGMAFSASATETNTAATTLEEVGTSKDDSHTNTNPVSAATAFIRVNSEDNDDDEDELQSSTQPSIKSISNDISLLTSNLNHHIHISTPAAMKENLHDFKAQVQNQIPAHIQMEKLKATKREQSIYQKFESMAGMTSKSIAEESAERHAELTLLKEKVLEAGGWDELRTSRFLKEIAEIREMLRKEREERMKKDEIILNQIVESREFLQRTLLDSLAKE
jgi:hypothetical protein